MLFKGGEALETAGNIETVLLDKTGTITSGEPSVTEVFAASGIEEAELWRLVVAAESGSEHPVGRAIVAEAVRRRIGFVPPSSFEAVPGRGVVAVVGGRRVVAGTLDRLAAEGVDVAAGPDR